MLAFILLSLTALMLYLLVCSMLNIEYETSDGKIISSTYLLSRETIFHTWALIKAVMGSTEALSKFILSELSTWDERPRVISAGKLRFVYISSPDDIQIVLNSSNFIEKGQIYKFLRNSLGNGLVTAPPSIWKSHRRHIAPAFSSSSIKWFFNNFNEHTDKLLQVLEKTCATGEKFDLLAPFTKTAFYMFIGSISDGNIPLTDEEQDELLECIAHLTRLYGIGIFRPWLHPPMMFKLYIKLMGYQKYIDFKDNMTDKALSERIRMHIKKKSDNEYEEGDITLSDELFIKVDKGLFSYKDVFEEIVNLLVAGSEPTSFVLCFTLLLLAGNPELQEKAYDEISNIIDNDDDKPIDMAMVEEMKYLEMCLKESLRLFPPIPFAMRRATADIKLSSEFTIKNGTEVLIPHVAVQRDPKYYENPLVWNPENFTEEKERSRHKFAFIPFSGGPRGCIGNHYVMMAGRVILAKVLRKYRLTTDVKPENVRIEMDVILRSKIGFPVRLHRRC